MKKHLLFIGVFFPLLMAALCYAAPPEYVAMKAGCPMAMDGILNEPAWKKAQSVDPFSFPWDTFWGPKQQTEAKIVWDDERLYFSFICEDKDIWAVHYNNFSAVSYSDCCEVFISPVPGGKERMDYLNYEINCIGTWLLGYHAPSRDKNFYWKDVSGIEIGRVINGSCNFSGDTDEGWILEFSVPYDHFKDFGAEFPPEDGQVVWLNLNRCDHIVNQYSQWSPNRENKSFHSPEDFGKVIFSTKMLK